MPDLRLTLALACAAWATCATSFAQPANLAGTYRSPEGGSYTVIATTTPRLYLIQGTDASGDKWEGAGYYTPYCSCIKSVFRFTTGNDRYKDNVGYHVFTVTDGGTRLVMKGGWSAPNEWAPPASIRSN